MVVDKQPRAFVVGLVAHARSERETTFKLADKRGRRIQAGQHVEHVAVLIEDVVRAVAGDRALERAAIAVVDRHARHRSLARPVEDELLAQKPADVLVRVERRAEQPAVRTRQILIELAEHAQVQNRPSLTARRSPGRLQIRVPVEPRYRRVLLVRNRIDPGGELVLGRTVGFAIVAREQDTEFFLRPCAAG